MSAYTPAKKRSSIGPTSIRNSAGCSSHGPAGAAEITARRRVPAPAIARSRLAVPAE
jgi:hypothetical protein